MNLLITKELKICLCNVNDGVINSHLYNLRLIFNQDLMDGDNIKIQWNLTFSKFYCLYFPKLSQVCWPQDVAWDYEQNSYAWRQEKIQSWKWKSAHSKYGQVGWCGEPCIGHHSHMECVSTWVEWSHHYSYHGKL